MVGHFVWVLENQGCLACSWNQESHLLSIVLIIAGSFLGDLEDLGDLGDLGGLGDLGSF